MSDLLISIVKAIASAVAVAGVKLLWQLLVRFGRWLLQLRRELREFREWRARGGPGPSAGSGAEE